MPNREMLIDILFLLGFFAFCFGIYQSYGMSWSLVCGGLLVMVLMVLGKIR